MITKSHTIITALVMLGSAIAAPLAVASSEGYFKESATFTQESLSPVSKVSPQPEVKSAQNVIEIPEVIIVGQLPKAKNAKKCPIPIKVGEKRDLVQGSGQVTAWEWECLPVGR